MDQAQVIKIEPNWSKNIEQPKENYMTEAMKPANTIAMLPTTDLFLL